MKVNFSKCLKMNDMLNYELKNNSERKLISDYFSVKIQHVSRLDNYSHGFKMMRNLALFPAHTFIGIIICVERFVLNRIVAFARGHLDCQFLSLLPLITSCFCSSLAGFLDPNIKRRIKHINMYL